ncbi:hypothetical protein NECID01_0569 [Nematocida sp. AWRm77]|nr:hypothetical protein NECID01_0569 [Nematocida sp. AWRm77]
MTSAETAGRKKQMSCWVACVLLSMFGWGEAAGTSCMPWMVQHINGVLKASPKTPKAPALSLFEETDLLKAISSLHRPAPSSTNKYFSNVHVNFDQSKYPLWVHVDESVLNYIKVELVTNNVDVLINRLHALSRSAEQDRSLCIEISLEKEAGAGSTHIKTGVSPYSRIPIENIVFLHKESKLVLSFRPQDVLEYFRTERERLDSRTARRLMGMRAEMVFAKHHFVLEHSRTGAVTKGLLFSEPGHFRLGDSLPTHNTSIEYTYMDSMNKKAKYMLGVEDIYKNKGSFHFNKAFLDSIANYVSLPSLGSYLVSKVGKNTTSTNGSKLLSTLRMFDTETQYSSKLQVPKELKPFYSYMERHRNLAYSIFPDEVCASKENFGHSLFSTQTGLAENRQVGEAGGVVASSFSFTTIRLHAVRCIAQYVWSILYNENEKKYAKHIKNITEILIPGIDHGIYHVEDVEIFIESMYYYVYHVLKDIPTISENKDILFRFMFLNEPSLKEKNALLTIESKIKSTEKMSEHFRAVVLGTAVPAYGLISETANEDEDEESDEKCAKSSEKAKLIMKAQRRFKAVSSVAVSTKADVVKKVASVVSIGAAACSLIGSIAYIAIM